MQQTPMATMEATKTTVEEETEVAEATTTMAEAMEEVEEEAEETTTTMVAGAKETTTSRATGLEEATSPKRNGIGCPVNREEQSLKTELEPGQPIKWSKMRVQFGANTWDPQCHMMCSMDCSNVSLPSRQTSVAGGSAVSPFQNSNGSTKTLRVDHGRDLVKMSAGFWGPGKCSKRSHPPAIASLTLW